MMALLDHPGIVRLVEAFVQDGHVLVVTEYIAGSDLRQAVTCPAAPGVFWRIVPPLMNALEYLHGRGVIHGDLKPSNVLIDESGQPRLTDFGLSRLAGEKATNAMTFCGTPAYAAPEVCRGLRADRRSDLYSLGVLLYELLTGRRPLDGANVTETLLRHLHERPRSPGLVVDGIHPVLEAAVLKLLEKDPARRFHTVGQCWRAILPAVPAAARTHFSPEVRGSATVQRPSFAGLQAELERLLDAADAAHEPAPRLILLIGAPGTGKSRLMEELRFLRGLDGPAFLAPQAEERANLQAASGFVGRMTRQAGSGPAVALWDDLHHTPADVANMIVDAAVNWRGRGVWIFTAAEDEALGTPAGDLQQALARGAPGEIISIDRLSPDELTDLYHSALGVSELPRPWLTRAVASADGNPQLALEILRDDLDAGILAPSDGEGWAFQEQVSDSGAAMLVSGPERRLLELLAVAGHPVPETALVHGDTTDPVTALRAVADLLQRGTLRESDIGLVFRLPRYQEEIARLVSPERCQRYHALLADFIRSAAPVLRELPAELVQDWLLSHRLKSGEGAVAVNDANERASKARSTGNMAEELMWLRLAADYAVGVELRGLRQDILYRLGVTARITGDTMLARASFSEVLTLADALGNREAEAVAAFGLASVEQAAGNLAAAEVAYRRASASAAASGIRKLEGRAHLVLGVLRHTAGDMTGARHEGRLALALFRDVGERKSESRVAWLLGDAAYGLGEYADANQWYQLALEMAEQLNDAIQAASCRASIGLTLQAKGQMLPAFEHYRAALAAFRSQHHPRGEAIALLNIGMAELDLGEPRRALETVDAAVSILQTTGPAQAMADALSVRAQAREAIADADGAARDRAAALETARAADAVSVEAAILLASARAARRRGEIHAAELAVGQARDLASKLQDPGRIAETILLAGQLAAERSDFVQARTLCAEALAEFRRIGAKSGETESLTEFGFIELDAANAPNTALSYFQQACEIGTSTGNRRYLLEALYGQCEALFALNRQAEAASIARQLAGHLREMDDRAALRHVFFRAAPPGLPLPPAVLELAQAVVRSSQEIPAPMKIYAATVLAAHRAGDPAEEYRQAQTAATALGLIRTEKRLAAIQAQCAPRPAAEAPRPPALSTKESARMLQQPIRIMLTTAQALLSTFDPDALFTALMDQVIQVTGAERGFLMLRDAEGNLSFRISRNIRQEEISQPQFSTSRSIIDHVVETGEIFLSADILADERFGRHQSVKALALRSVLCVPIPEIGGGHTAAGVIYVDNPFESGLFEPSEKMLLEAIAALASLALANIRVANELRVTRDLAQREAARLRDQLAGRHQLGDMIGRSAAMKKLFDLVERVMHSSAPVLIMGETGTGKEMVARTLHFGGPHSRGPFIGINCAALPESLLEAELFGIEKGVATGVSARAGLIEQAHQGTLFLDEVGDMSLSTQARILRVLQEREVVRVGGRKRIPVELRVISATHRDLAEEIRHGKFREDLLYRLNVISLTLPPLRDRIEDVPLLALHFLGKFAREEGRAVDAIAPDVQRLLASYHWPGNVRELENVLHRAVILETGPVLSRAALPDTVLAQAPSAEQEASLELGGEGLQEIVNQLERKLLLAALDQSNGVKKDAAELLKLSPRMMSHYLKKHRLN